MLPQPYGAVGVLEGSAALSECEHVSVANRVSIDAKFRSAVVCSVLKVRQKLLKQALAWAGYIHLGA